MGYHEWNPIPGSPAPNGFTGWDGLWHWVYHISGGFSELDPQVTMGFNTKMLAYDLDDLRGFLIIMDYDEKQGWW